MTQMVAKGPSEGCSDRDALRSLGDEALFELCRGDSDTAFRVLVERHLPLIRRMAMNVLRDAAEAEDVAQETFISVWRHRQTWRPDARFTTWLYRIAMNRAIDHARARRATPQSDEVINRLADARVDCDQTPDQQLVLERQDLSGGLKAALDRLPKRQRTALTLFYFEDCDVQTIASVMMASEQSVRSFLKRGRAALKANIRKQKKLCDHDTGPVFRADPHPGSRSRPLARSGG